MFGSSEESLTGSNLGISCQVPGFTRTHLYTDSLGYVSCGEVEVKQPTRERAAAT